MQERLNGLMPRNADLLKDRIKLARAKRGMTQGALAKAAGLKQPDISKLELGLIQQSTAMARLSAALNVPAAWLELGEGPEPDWSDPGAPPAPPAGFADRHVVSESEWALLQDLKDAMSSPRLAQKVGELRDEVAELREFAKNVYTKRPV